MLLDATRYSVEEVKSPPKELRNYLALTTDDALIMEKSEFLLRDAITDVTQRSNNPNKYNRRLRKRESNPPSSFSFIKNNAILR